ncbi:MAG TPA: class I SAM-dependent methyltransferase [Streptosporangiaceae bacterium]|nr:class I SAM-dependent methyltransferase [Streptosporangiaceae bacterium]
MATFDALVSDTLSAPFSGWDFSWLAARSASGALPWSYQSEVGRRAAVVEAMLDMGTGGGERLSKLSGRPRLTVATEAWAPNVPVAAARLRPLGVAVVQDEGARDNNIQDGSQRGRLPFRDGAFGLVANRHEAFRATEVGRVLAAGGAFITQQVDLHSYDALYEVLGLEVPEQPQSWLPLARRQVEDAGLHVLAAVRGEERHEFHDVGAIVYYLRVVNWAVPQYTFDACEQRLRELHETPRIWPVLVRHRRFLLVAAKDS